MAYWTTRGLRGSVLEEMINVTNTLYEEKGLALIQKIPTPIKPITIDKVKRTITLAYFEQKSTVDYIGVAQGVPLCFDAKETAKESLPLMNIHEHQIVFMERFTKQQGQAFLIVYFKRYEEYYLLPVETIRLYFDQAAQGGRRSIPYAAFDKKYQIAIEGGRYLHYLKTVSLYIDENK